jgi:hypothetical protein
MKKKVEFYEGIEDLPHINYMKFNKESLRADNVGFRAIDLEARVQAAAAYVGANQNQKALVELDNLYLALAYARNEFDPKGIAFAAQVKSIGGVLRDDFTTKGLEDTLKECQKLGITKKEIDERVDYVKKNLKQSLSYSFLIILLLTLISIVLYSLT